MRGGRRRLRVPVVVYLAIAAALAAAAFVVLEGQLQAPGGPSPDAGEAVVVWVIDGDTIDVEVDGVRERVRLVGVNTPETVDRNRPEQCFGKEASARTTELLPPGTVVRLERDAVGRDQYDRILAYVWRAADDLLVNLALIEDGFADAVTYGDNEALYETFAAAEATARAEGRGLWGACGAADVSLTGG